MLYLFVTEDCVRRFVPDLILSKLILSQINDTISVQRPHFYNNLVQYRAYTVYKMCLEEEQDSPLEQKASRIGCCWAQMAGDKENDALCQTGKRLYLLMKERCEEQLLTLDRVFCVIPFAHHLCHRVRGDVFFSPSFATAF